MRSFLLSPLYRLLCWSLFVLWFIGLNILSSLPAQELPPMGLWDHIDKVFHFLAFVLGAFFLATAWTAGHEIPPRRRFILAFLIIVLFGMLDELRQLFIPGRSGGDWGDALANSLGTLVGCLAAWFFQWQILRPLLRHGTTSPAESR